MDDVGDGKTADAQCTVMAVHLAPEDTSTLTLWCTHYAPPPTNRADHAAVTITHQTWR